MEVQKENVMSAYNVADENGKQLLKALFPSVEFEQAKDDRPITDRVKTFEDACKVLNGGPLVSAYENFLITYAIGVDGKEVPTGLKDVFAFLKLRIITAALNEGWQPPFDKETYMYWPWFDYYTKEEVEEMDDEERQSLGLVGAYADYGALSGLGYVSSSIAWTNAHSHYGSRLAYKSRELAEYSGNQFKDIWADYCFTGAFE